MECWTFGDFVLDLDTHELVRAGTPVSISPKAFQLLGILVENHPKALSKTELQNRLWPSIFVVEKNLTNLVSEIREALGDDPVHPRFIRTVHRFGYAFREARVTQGRSSNVTACAAGATAAPRDDHRHNLPVSLTNFIGREREIVELRLLPRGTRVSGARAVGQRQHASGAPGQGAHGSRQHDVFSGRHAPNQSAAGRK
jgi:DNA-binding winged helix-turn-helix (wHTH) protein